ncbi:MAG: hypothetical protein M1541_12015, partial [Acidobacteria bacterium]|nr:hypothetical protein [Acidobacteriota bacterium]
QPSIINPDYPQTGHINSGKLNFGPRLGVAYALGTSGKTVLRAGFGMYHQRYAGMFLTGMITTNAIYQKALSLTSSGYASGPVFPNRLEASALAKSGTTVAFADPNLRTPYTEQGTLAIEHQLANSVGLTVSYLWNRGIQGLGVRDLNIGPLGPVV